MQNKDIIRQIIKGHAISLITYFLLYVLVGGIMHLLGKDAYNLLFKSGSMVGMFHFVLLWSSFSGYREISLEYMYPRKTLYRLYMLSLIPYILIFTLLNTIGIYFLNGTISADIFVNLLIQITYLSIFAVFVSTIFNISYNKLGIKGNALCVIVWIALGTIVLLLIEYASGNVDYYEFLFLPTYVLLEDFSRVATIIMTFVFLIGLTKTYRYIER